MLACLLAGIIIAQSQALQYIVQELPIKNVTISGSSAEIARLFTIKDVPPGSHDVVIENLPYTVDDNSIEVKGKGKATVVSTMLEHAMVRRDTVKSYKDRLDQLTILTKSMEEISSILALQTTAVNARWKAVPVYVDDVLGLTPKNKNASERITIEEVNDLLNYQEREQKRYNEDIAALNLMSRTINGWAVNIQKMSDFLRSYGKYTNTLPPMRPLPDPELPVLAPVKAAVEELQVLVEALPTEPFEWPSSTESLQLHINVYVPDSSDEIKARTLTFELSYMTAPVSWTAEYDLRLERLPAINTSAITNAGDYALRMGLYAVVAQETTEDWTEVHLHLSTTQATKRIQRPPTPHRAVLGLTYRHTHYGKATGTQQDDQVPPSRRKKMQQTAQASAEKGDWRPTMEPTVMPSAAPSCVPTVVPSAMPSAVPTAAPGAPPAAMLRAQAEEQASMRASNVGVSGTAGQAGSPVIFHPQHVVNVTSNHLPDAPTRTTRLFIGDTVLHPILYSYAVPTFGDKKAYLRAWSGITTTSTTATTATTGTTAATNTTTSSDTCVDASGGDSAGDDDCSAAPSTEMPLLDSKMARVFIEDAFAGTTSVTAAQPGSPVRLGLGHDKNLEVHSTFVLPHKGSRSEDKHTSWFVSPEKIKYLVESVEWAFTVRSSYTQPHLVLLSEYLPHVSEEGIRVELLAPAEKALLSVQPPAHSSSTSAQTESDLWSEDVFIAAVLAHPALAAARNATVTVSRQQQMLAFAAKGSGNVVWAQWVLPGHTARASLHYRVIYPDGRTLYGLPRPGAA